VPTIVPGKSPVRSRREPPAPFVSQFATVIVKPRPGQRPDAVIDTLRREVIKADPNLKATPIIAVSSYAMKGDEERIREGGCEAYVSKPISVSRFLETIRQFIPPALA